VAFTLLRKLKNLNVTSSIKMEAAASGSAEPGTGRSGLSYFKTSVRNTRKRRNHNG
jgi:hypothetical protein